MKRETFANILLGLLALDIVLFFLVPFNDRTIWFFGVLIIAPYFIAATYVVAIWRHKKNNLKQK